MISSESILEFFKSIYPDADKIIIHGLESKDVKGYGYGEPVLVEVLREGKSYRYVLSTIKEDRFGHEYISDRAGEILWSYHAFNDLPKHVRAVHVGYIDECGNLNPIGEYKEFFLVTQYIEGRLYKDFLFEIMEKGYVDSDDLLLVDKLASYIADIHSTRPEVDKWLYVRRIRDLVGHGECIMGIVDSYIWSGKEVVSKEFLKEIEVKAVEWRWRLRKYMDRLSKVHGDYHPWNILVLDNGDIRVLDRSRGDYGEPADDVSALTINYIFFSLMKYGEFKDPFKKLYRRFFEKYLAETEDEDIFRVIQPFYAWRALVVANPVWYPNMDPVVRTALLNFASKVLETEYLELDSIDELLVV